MTPQERHDAARDHVREQFRETQRALEALDAEQQQHRQTREKLEQAERHRAVSDQGWRQQLDEHAAAAKKQADDLTEQNRKLADALAEKTRQANETLTQANTEIARLSEEVKTLRAKLEAHEGTEEFRAKRKAAIDARRAALQAELAKLPPAE